MVEMSTSNDFPGSCITNLHILHDYAEIAYIVCTHAIPATSGNTHDANSPEQILIRLRNAEKQFRQASILVALDTAKLEVFTFYKKVDVVKDQRTILNKFGLVCRLNSCIIARKSTARVLELLKPESSRLYQLFTSALLHSIQLSPKISGVAIPIGFRRYLVPASAGSERNGREVSGIDWQLCRIDLQVTTGGQVILTVQRSRNGALNQLKPDRHDYDGEENVVKKGSFIYLVPTGQLARYVGTWSEQLSTEGFVGSSKYPAEVYRSWPSYVRAWLRDYPTAQAIIGEDETWVEIEVPVLEDGTSADKDENTIVTWKTICWPSSLVFVIASTNALNAGNGFSAVDFDPLSFIQDWYTGSAERNVAMAKADVLLHQKDNRLDEEPLFSDDVTFEDPDPVHLFGPPAFPASQTVYPTPPEGMLTQHTPGLSIDGIAPTPIHAGTVPHVVEISDEIEMQDVAEPRLSSVKGGIYEDDLFEEIPDENFDSGGVGDEPNWDFFDEPGFEAHNHDPASTHRVHHPNGSGNEKHEAANVSDDTAYHESLIAAPAIFAHVDVIDSTKNEASNVHKFSQHSNHTKTESIENGPRSSLSPASRMSISDDENAPASTSVHTHETDQKFVSDQRESVGDMPARRRSSVFDAIPQAGTSPKRDTKYEVKGKYWFDHTSKAAINDSYKTISTLPARSASTSSDSSMTSDQSGSIGSRSNSVQPQIPPHPWTKFESQGGIHHNISEDEHENASSRAYTSELLNVIKLASGDELFLYDIKASIVANRRAIYDGQRSSLVAQILVEQITQSGLYCDARYSRLGVKATIPSVKLSMDHSEVKQAVINASLAEVAVFSTSQSATGRTKIVRLESPRIHVKRTDKAIKINPSALPYWETLGLQPLNGQKDVTALCIHPSSSNVSDGCAAFLGRIADIYNGCNFGIHDVGRIAGVTNDGLIPWSSNSNSARSLVSVCQRLGSALSSTFSAVTTVLIYMVSPVEELFCYREMCHAFTVLFDSFIKAPQHPSRSVELALQIIPISFLASPEILVIPSQDSYLALALEVYNRLPPKIDGQRLAACGTAVILDKPQPKEIEFDLSVTALNPLHKNGEQLHLAYSYSFDKQWLTAAWCDERGTVSLTMSYGLRNTSSKEGGVRSRREVLRDLWDVSHDIMERQRSRWRLAVARSGFYEDDELRDWLSFINQNNVERKTVARLILLSVMVEPSTLLRCPASLLKGPTASSVGHGHNVSATPVSTPQTITTSPDQGIAATPTSTFQPTNAPTPPDHNFETSVDQEVTLFNPNDDCWSAVFAFGINQSHDPLSIRPAAASGLLIKRIGGKEDVSGLTSIEVHLVATSRLTQTAPTQVERESLLEGILMQFRRLATLAVTRGCIDQDREYVPWHVATAVKGSRILGEVL